DFGLDPKQIPAAAYPPGRVLGYVEAHIEQGPVLDRLGQPLGVVEAIMGQSRLWLRFEGKAGHAGTLPMEERQDALAAAAEFVGLVEVRARECGGLRATVGMLSVAPGAINVVPGVARLTLDIRHGSDQTRTTLVQQVLAEGRALAERRRVRLHVETEQE